VLRAKVRADTKRVKCGGAKLIYELMIDTRTYKPNIQKWANCGHVYGVAQCEECKNYSPTILIPCLWLMEDGAKARIDLINDNEVVKNTESSWIAADILTDEELEALPKSAEDAKAMGSMYYYQEPCTHDHKSPRLASSKHCVVCCRLSARKRDAAYKQEKKIQRDLQKAIKDKQ